jgi:hypothetical protein
MKLVNEVEFDHAIAIIQRALANKQVILKASTGEIHQPNNASFNCGYTNVGAEFSNNSIVFRQPDEVRAIREEEIRSLIAEKVMLVDQLEERLVELRKELKDLG